MNFSDLPPELLKQAPLVAVLLWIAVQSRNELVSALARLTERIDDVRLEVRALRIEIGGRPPTGRANGPTEPVRDELRS